MRKYIKLIIVALTLCLIDMIDIYAITREEVISNAYKYVNYGWTCGENNIFDVYI